jgi:hypothetical protein
VASASLQSDIVVGARINEAHQDPNVPVELGLRPQNRRPAGNPPFEGSPRSVYRRSINHASILARHRVAIAT